MNTAQVSIELILAGILALCAFALPFWTGSAVSADLLQSDALIGILGIAYLLGVIFKIELYSEHRSFYWVRFDEDVSENLGLTQISVFNLKNIRKIGQQASLS